MYDLLHSIRPAFRRQLTGNMGLVQCTWENGVAAVSDVSIRLPLASLF